MLTIDKQVRIGCASAFYGDSQLAARQLVDKGGIDYLVFDYLAESTMAILARMAMKDEKLGFAIDFVTVAMKDVLADCAKKGIKVIANAGGVNVPGCIDALKQLSGALGLDLNIAGVYGDDLTKTYHKPLVDIATGEPLPNKLASSNAYLGAEPIVDALRAGADIVVTGRVVDSAVVLAPLIYEFDWGMTDYDKLSQGSLAGHVIECGAQCTGGNFTDWHLVPDFADMSYPIATVKGDGTFTITIPKGTGGIATRASVAEQIVYEIGDPANYLLPDVACDWTDILVTETALDTVRVEGAKGRAPGPDYKVCSTWLDGYRLLGSFYLGGVDAAQKAHTNLSAWVKRCENHFKQTGIDPFRRTHLAAIGAEDIYGAHAKGLNPREVMAIFGLHHNDKNALKFAASELAYLATSAAPGMTGFGSGRASPHPMMRVSSSFVAKSDIPVTVQVNDQLICEKPYDQYIVASEPATGNCYNLPHPDAEMKMKSVPLEDLVWARSGDKGDSANIGIIIRDKKHLPAIAEQVTAEAVADYFSHLVDGPVTRFDMPGIGGWNFLLEKALGGGATASLRPDNQAKTYAQMLLSLRISI